MNISSNMSAIAANQVFMNNTANNVANANTPGFVPSDTTFSNTGNGVTAKTFQAPSTGSAQSQTDLAKEIPNQMVITNSVASNVTAINAQSKMLGSLLDLKA